LEDVGVRRVAVVVAAVDAFDPDVLHGELGHRGRVHGDPVPGVPRVGGIRVLDQHPLDEDFTGGRRAHADVDAMADAAVGAAGCGQVDLTAADDHVVAAVDVQTANYRHAGQLDDPVLAAAQVEVLVAPRVGQVQGRARVQRVTAGRRRPG